MKKFYIIALTLVFCIASLGVSGTLHYCAGQIKTISMDNGHSKSCDGCSTGVSQDQSCCSEQTTLFQYDDFQFQKSTFNITFFPAFIVTIPYFIPLDDSGSSNNIGDNGKSLFTFFSSKADTQSKLCVFII